MERFELYIRNIKKGDSIYKLKTRASPAIIDKLSSLENTEEFKTHKTYKLSDLVKFKIDHMEDFELYISKYPHDNSIYTLKVHYGLTERYKTVFCSKDLNLVKII